MTAPTSMPVMPAVARSSGPTSSSASGPDSAPAFASALDDALTGGGTPAGGGSTVADDEAPQPDAETPADAAPVVPVVLVPGLWALMTAVTPLTTAATGTAATTAAASLIGAVTGTGGAPAAVLTALVADTAAPTAPAAPAAPAVVPVPAAAPVAADPAAALAAAVGLTLVVDTSPAQPGDPAVAPAPDAAALAQSLPTTGGSGSADAGTDGATGGPAAGLLAPAEEATSGVDSDSVFTLGGTSATSAAAPAAEITPTPIGPDDAPVAQQLGRQIAVLRNAPDGSQTMTVVITPESLGPVTIAVTVTDGTLDLTLHGSSDHGRHALLDALPDLRRDLEGAGLSFSKLEVGSDAGSGARSAQQQLLDARAGQQGASGQPGQQDPRGARTWGSAPDPVAVDGSPLTTSQSASAGVDVRV